MITISIEQDVIKTCDLVKKYTLNDTRVIIGIAGPPASGKSTLAKYVVQHLNKENGSEVPVATMLPMDGYHLNNKILESKGLLSRKGAPEKFNAYDFCETVKRLTESKRETFHPKFVRYMDLAIANAIAIRSETKIIVVEGNYLLLSIEPWASLRKVFSATTFICPPIETLQKRLQNRWIEHGLNPKEAALRVSENDLVNTELIINNSYEADIRLTQNYTEQDRAMYL